jgi:hypothetical protein
MSDGRFSDKPLRSSLSREELRSAGAYSEKVDLSSDHSPAVQRELRALLEPLAQEIWAANSAPLHRRTPPAARNLGQPLASAALVQEYLIGLVFLRVAGWTFMFFGGLFMLAAMGLLIGITFGEGREPILAAFMVGAIGLGIAAVGAWFGIIRGRVITEMCWFCPRGMIWMTNSVFDWFPWEDVRDVYCNLNADRPAIGISFGRNVSWISFANTARSRQIVEHIEQKASAACAKAFLQHLAEGKTLRFGTWRLSRFSIREGDHEIIWKDVLDVEPARRELCILHYNSNLTADLDEVPFPTLFTALTLACCAHSRQARP